jgi:5-methylcytosine-specific restriction enzyme A
MPTFLLTWNPAKWHWRDMQADIQRCQSDGYLDDRWSCGRNKQIQPGDRIFLLRQGQEPRGLIASGIATSSVFEDEHWGGDDTTRSPIARYVNIRFDVLLDADQEPIFRRDWLEAEALVGVHWNTQVSGIRIPEQMAQALEQEWARFLASRNIVQYETVAHHSTIAEESNTRQYLEGATQTVLVNRYERNIEARRACIRHFGLSCGVCGFNFEQTYGEIGIGFIHTHHLTPLANIGAQYTLDPLQDLRPVCANCHDMLHQRTPPFTIEELRSILENAIPSTRPTSASS